MSISIKIDTDQYLPATRGFVQTVTARSAWKTGTKQNVVLDNYTGVLMCKPLQFYDDWEATGTVTRYPLSGWTGDTAHWEDLYNSSGTGNGLLNAHDGAGKITSKETFGANTSFLVSWMTCGHAGDKTAGIELEFGQWKLTLSTSGDAELSRGGVVRFADIITDSIADQFVELLIMPYVNNSLLVRRLNSNDAGMLVSMNPGQDTAEMGTSPPTIIAAAKFSVTPKNVLCKQFSLTELTYDTDADYELVSSPVNCTCAPTAAQDQDTTVDGLINYGGGLFIALRDATLDLPFVADGITRKFRAVFGLQPLAHKTPMIRGATIGFEPEPRITLPNPADISDDVKSYEIHIDETADKTEAIIEVCNPELYDLSGACARLCTIEMDGINIFRGILAEPPVYSHNEDGERYYTLRVQSIYRYLQTASIINEINFAGRNHVEAISWLCWLAGLDGNDILFDITTDPLPAEYGTDGQISNDWQIKLFDSAETWIKKICDETGWRLTDGISSGVYVLKYVDPLAFPTIADKDFHTEQASMTAQCQNIFSWEEYSLEPECNEFHLIFCDESGNRCDAVYYDAASADGALPNVDRPRNWLGFVKRGGFEIGQRTTAHAQQLALRVGAEVTRRIDILRITARYPAGLWVNDVINIIDEGSIAKYRITTMSISGVNEVPGNEMRNCDILAEKLEDGS